MKSKKTEPHPRAALFQNSKIICVNLFNLFNLRSLRYFFISQFSKIIKSFSAEPLNTK